VTQAPTAQNVADFRRGLDQLIPFIENVYIPDAMKLADRYPEYLEIGAGPANLLSFGVFPDPSGKPLFEAGRYVDRGPGDHGHRRVFPLTDRDIADIDESVKHAYYGGGKLPDDRRAGDAAAPNLDKRGAYSWVKAPRLGDHVYQVGALARMIISGRYRGGLSAMDRLLANAYETSVVASAMRGWLDQLTLDASGYRPVASVPPSGSAYALSEAPRGALAHWLEYADGKVTKYRIITPTSWNASPRDDREQPGPIEQALIGVRVADRTQPIEVYRIIHSFDPCMGCAVHMTVVD
jgi:hydrogenase large subunit